MWAFAKIQGHTLCVIPETDDRVSISYGDDVLVADALLAPGGTLSFEHGPWVCELGRRRIRRWLRKEMMHLVVRVGGDILYEAFFDEHGKESSPHEVVRSVVFEVGCAAGLLMSAVPALTAYYLLVPYDGRMRFGSHLIIATGLVVGIMIGQAASGCLGNADADRALYANGSSPLV